MFGVLGAYMFLSLSTRYSSPTRTLTYADLLIWTQGEVGCTHSLSTTLGPFPDYAHLVQLGGGVSLRSDRFIFIGRQSP